MNELRKQGFSIHCHHNILCEYCYDYDMRVRAIKDTKPKHEIKIRLRLFKLVSEEAIKDIPADVQKAYTEYQKADAEWQKVDAEWQKTYAAYTWQKAYEEWLNAYAGWAQADKEAFHKKWCGCDEWINGEIVFAHKI